MELIPNILLPRMQELFVSSARLLYDKKKGVAFAPDKRRELLLADVRAFMEFGESLKGKDWATFQALRPLMLCFLECLYAKIFEGDWQSATLSGSLTDVSSPRDYLVELATNVEQTKELKKQMDTPEFKVFFAEAMTLDREARLRLFQEGQVESLLLKTSPIITDVDAQTASQPFAETAPKVLDQRPLMKTKKFWVTLALAGVSAALLAVGGRQLVQDHYKERMVQRQDAILAKEFSKLGGEDTTSNKKAKEVGGE